MSTQGFEKVRVMIAESGGLRRQIRNVIHESGFARVAEAGDVGTVRDAIDLDLVDLLIAEAGLDGGDICELVRSVRHFKFGKNPFLAVIMLGGDLDKETTMKIIDSGPDDLLVKPITIGAVKDRVMALTNSRKKFVVTSDYIGPTRRKKARPGSMEIPEMDVPNPVKDKIEGILKTGDFHEAIAATTRALNLQKLERDAYQVVWLSEQLLPKYGNGRPDETVVPMIDRLVMVSDDIGRRLRGTPFDHVGELCSSLVTVAGALQKSPLDPPERDLKLLPQVAAAVKASFAMGAENQAAARNIAASVIDAA